MPPVPPVPPVYGQQPAYGQQPPAYGQQPPAYGQQPPVYGQPAAYAQQPFGAPAKKSPLLSIFSLVSSGLALLGSFVLFFPIIGGILGLFLPAAGIVLGFLGKKKEPEAKGLWLTGLILGFIGLALAILSIVLWIVLFSLSNGFNGTYDYYDY